MEENKVFKTVSKMSDKEYMAFQHYTAMKILVPICIICSLVFIVLGIARIFEDVVVGVVFIVVGLLFPLIYMKAYKREINKKKYKSNMIGDDVSNYMEFTEDGFNEKTYRGEEQVGVTSLKYSDMFKIVDYKEYFFVYISKVQAFIVSKDGFIQGTPEDFKAFIAGKGIKVK